MRVTLYSRGERVETGLKGLAIPAAVLVALLLWYAAAAWLLGRFSRSSRPVGGLLAGAAFVPLLATLPTVVGVLTSESYAGEYWIDRSVKVELLLGLPALVLLLQAGVVIWLRYGLTWRRAGPMVGILLLAFVLRYAGMGWGLPFAYQPEETSIYFRWAMEAALHGEWNPHYFQNPSLMIYLLSVEFLLLFAVCRALLFGQDPGDLYMVFRGEQDLFYSVGRLNSVVLGAATVFLVYLIGRRLWSERAGLVAAALLAVNFLHVRNSQYAVNDVPSAFFLVFSFYYAVRLAEKGRWRDYLLAGLMAGLAASTKYNAGVVVVSVAAAHWVYHGKVRGMIRWNPLWKLGLSAVAALAGFVLGTPYSVLDYEAFREGFLSQLELGGAAWSGQSLAPTAWQILAGVVHGTGLVASILALLGILLLVARDRRRALLVLSFPLAYFAFMAAMELFFVRWVVPLVPFATLLGAYGLEGVIDRVPGRSRQLAAAGLLILALLQPTAYSVRLDWLAHQRDTRQEANEWAERNLPAGSKVAVEAFSLLDQEAVTFRPTLQQLYVLLVWRATMHDLAYYRDNGFDYLAVSSFLYDRAFTQPERYPDRVEFYRQLDRECQLVAAFYPRADGGSTPFALDDLDTPFWYLFSYDRPGPTVKVYRLRG